MSEFRKAPGDRPYFVTLTVVGWIDVFTRSCYCDEIIKSMEFCRARKGLKVYAYCIMSSHVHLIVSSPDGRLPNILRDSKSFTAKRILELINDHPQESRKSWLLHLFRYYANLIQQNSDHHFWDKTSHPIELTSNEMFDQKVEYIHRNPVEAMLVNDPASYVYSSANPDSPFKVDES